MVVLKTQRKHGRTLRKPSITIMSVQDIVLILDGISEIDAHVRNILGYLICIRHLIRARVITNWMFLSDFFFVHACATCSESPSYISTMIQEVLNQIYIVV